MAHQIQTYFNSIKVRLKLIKDGGDGRKVTYFNSIKVRLKLMLVWQNLRARDISIP